MANHGRAGRAKLMLIALIITVIIVIAGNSAADLVVGRWPGQDGGLGFIDAPDVAVLDLVFTGLPFFVLALCRDSRLTMWAVAALLSIASWAYAVWRLRQGYLANFEGGADIGLGLIMMAAPFAILIILIILGLVLRAAAHLKR